MQVVVRGCGGLKVFQLASEVGGKLVDIWFPGEQAWLAHNGGQLGPRSKASCVHPLLDE